MKRLIQGMILFTLLNGCTMKEQADLIIINALVYTVDSTFSNCSAIAVRNGIILATGEDDQILNRYRSTNIKDLKGASLYPGFNDAHCHLFGLGLSLNRVDLRGADSFDEILLRLKKRYDSIQPKYLAGDGWDQNLWENKEFPDNSKLNELFPQIPVVLSRIDFHAVIVNDAAIKALGITPGDSSIPPGEALFSGGKFKGVFLENTADRFKNVLPEPDEQESREILLAAQKECFRYGLTSLSHAGESLGVINTMESLYSEQLLKIRTDIWLTPNKENLERFTKPYRDERMRISTIKLYVDGALGSRGALMIEPYSDSPSHKGIKVITREEFERLCGWAYEHGFQVATHCIGDAANREALTVYSKVLSPGNNLRWRIEHSQVIDEDDFDLFGKYSIVPSVQPTHCTSDMLWADERLGSRLVNAYAYKRLLDQLGWIPSGTDFPIEQVNPLYTFFAAVFRKNLNFVPEGGFQMENALSREEALKSMTLWAAKASFEDGAKGSIEPGKYADFVVLDRDIMTAQEKMIPGTKVLMTFVAGELVYNYNLLP
ncbi:MAG: amidohydrolase [Bacteroidales bacterium]|nr:amidohydrolase [Bacteroidales bacterium]